MTEFQAVPDVQPIWHGQPWLGSLPGDLGLTTTTGRNCNARETQRRLSFARPAPSRFPELLWCRLYPYAQHGRLAAPGVLYGRAYSPHPVLLFSSDHGDYLGDYHLSGKNSFYESATRVPLLVRLPGALASSSCHGLTTLSDVTATILGLAGCPLPAHMDCIPLPQLGLPVEAPRDRVVGSLRRGWMLIRDHWKLCKYARGGSLLYNLDDDPSEQHNLVGEGRYAAVYQRLDAELSAAIMDSIDVSHSDKRVYTHTLSSSREFGRPGWPREYPGQF